MLLNQQTCEIQGQRLWIKSKQTEANTAEDTGQYQLHSILFPEKSNRGKKLFCSICKPHTAVHEDLNSNIQYFAHQG